LGASAASRSVTVRTEPDVRRALCVRWGRDVQRAVIGDLIPYQNDGEGCTAIASLAENA